MFPRPLRFSFLLMSFRQLMLALTILHMEEEKILLKKPSEEVESNKKLSKFSVFQNVRKSIKLVLFKTSYIYLVDCECLAVTWICCAMFVECCDDFF